MELVSLRHRESTRGPLLFIPLSDRSAPIWSCSSLTIHMLVRRAIPTQARTQGLRRVDLRLLAHPTKTNSPICDSRAPRTLHHSRARLPALTHPRGTSNSASHACPASTHRDGAPTPRVVPEASDPVGRVVRGEHWHNRRAPVAFQASPRAGLSSVSGAARARRRYGEQRLEGASVG